MKKLKIMRTLQLLAAGALVLQVGGCNITFLDFVQTVLLGITAAGGIAIIENV